MYHLTKDRGVIGIVFGVFQEYEKGERREGRKHSFNDGVTLRLESEELLYKHYPMGDANSV